MTYIQSRGKIDGCRNEKELEERYSKLSSLKNILERDRRLSSAEERGESFEDDLFVSIGREGEFFLGHGGSHRLALCQLLALEEIPVRVQMRHKEWVDKVVSGVAPEEHPDVKLWK